MREAWSRIRRDRVTVSAGSLAYHWFLAFFPALIAGLGGLAAVLLVFGQPIGAAIAGPIPIGASAFRLAWTVLRWLASFLLISILFSACYHYGPNRRPPQWRWISPGSVLASAVLLAASLAFSFYISTFGHYGRTYGSLAGVAIFILWLFLTGLAVLLGGELNAVAERQASLARAGSRTPGGTGTGDDAEVAEEGGADGAAAPSSSAPPSGPEDGARGGDPGGAPAAGRVPPAAP